MSGTVTISQRLYDLWVAEAHRIHELLDAAQIPRGDVGMELSLSQRVEVAAGVLQGLVMKISKGPVH